MKRILLRSLGDPNIARDSPVWDSNTVTYRSLIEQAIRVPFDRQQGATIDEMRRGIRVLDALDGAQDEGVLELEDADWEHLKLKVEKMPWSFVDRRFVRFHDDVMDATDAVDMPRALVDGQAG